MITLPRRRQRRVILGVAVAGIGFQLFHLAEHTVQMVMWILHPQRAPFMSSWAHEASQILGRVDQTRASETTIVAARGMEYLHLVGNLVFLAGVGALWRFAQGYRSAQAQATRALWVQCAHVAEHVVLVASLLIVGRPVGLSTGFGLLDGTRLSTFRVWWHGGVNLLATVMCVVAVLALWSAVTERELAGRPIRLMRPVAATMLIPLALALVVGQPSGFATAGHAGHDLADDIEGFHLVDVAAQVGLDVQHSAFRWDVTMDPVAMMGGGACWLDVDRDGWLDLFVTDTWSDGEWGLWNSQGALPSTRVFRNAGGVFEERTEQWSAGIPARANGCVAADFDDDGFTDLYVTTARENLMLWNDGGEGFVEGAQDAGVDAYGWHTGAAAGDIDGDGRMDLVVAGYADMNSPVTDASTGFPNTFAPVADLVYLNRGVDESGRSVFEDVAVELGVEPDGPEYGLGVVLVDLDDDGDLDLYVANDTQANRLYLNDYTQSGALTLRDVSEQSGADDPNSGMGIALGDTNGDALPELVVTNLAGQGHATLSMIEAGATPTFVSESGAVRAAGLESTGWGAAFADFDRDGHLDLLLASGAIPIESLQSASEPVAIFCNLDGEGDGAGFVNSSEAVGLDAIDPRNGRAVALADYDNDGDVDAVVTAIGQPLVLLENRGAPGWSVTIDPGVPDPGMRVSVELSNGTTIDRHTMAGESWLSSHDPRLTIGFADGVEVARVVVTRSNGDVATFNDVEPGTVVHVAG